MDRSWDAMAAVEPSVTLHDDSSSSDPPVGTSFSIGKFNRGVVG